MGGYCWSTPTCRNLGVQDAVFEGKKAEDTSPRKSTPRTLKYVDQQYLGVNRAPEKQHANANATTGGAQECRCWVIHNKGDLGTFRVETHDKRGICTAIRRMEERIFPTAISRRYRYDGGSSPNSSQRDTYNTREGTRRSVRVVSSASRYRVTGRRLYRAPVLEPEVPEPVVPLPEPVPEPIVPVSVSPDLGLG